MSTLVSFLWHMHQPYYKDIVQGTYVMPWAYLHATKDYLRMAEIAAKHPHIHQTMNLVPSLILQLEDYAQGAAKDPMFDLAFAAAEDLDDAERGFILEKCFPVPVKTMVDPYPRYRELIERRSSTDLSVQEIRDIQVWWSLAWLDWSLQPRELLNKGRDFSTADQASLREIVIKAVQSVVPAYRRAQDAGNVEISTTPFYHPILPLLIDSRVDDRNVPVHVLYSEDAREQLKRSRQFMAVRFGKAPTGLWPSEGSVSDAVATLAVEQGFRWMATDESILAKSGVPVHEQRHRLYHPYNRSGLTIFFRDRSLSDLIGFQYMHSDPRDAAGDLVKRLAEIPDGAHVTLALDGENPWDYYPANGDDFIRFLFEGIAREPRLEAVTLGEASTRLPSESIDWLAPGSWANANFGIWIGHPEDHEAWRWIVQARTALMARKGMVKPEQWDEAYEELLVAEGSDWMWWFGNDFSSDSDAIFDGLFRQHIGNVYQLAGLPRPEGLQNAIKKSLGARNAVMVPTEEA